MEKDIEVRISIEGKNLEYFSTLVLSQEFNKHHHFVINAPQEAFESKQSHSVSNSKDLIGKKITITFGYANHQLPPNSFEGIISEISMAQNYGLHGDIILSGFSTTLLLESGKQMASFSEKDLRAIVKELADGAGDLKAQVNPKFKGKITYMTQYKETDFEFIQRLAAEYGEWFFFDGQNLFFGKPGEQEEMKLMYGSDISSIQLSMKILPSKFTHYTYKSENDEVLTANAPQKVGYLEQLGTTSMDASNKIFSKESYLPIHQRVASKKELDEVTTSKKSQIASSLVVLNATGDNPHVKIGSVVNIEVEKYQGASFVSESHGKYLITGIKHQITGTGEYDHAFEALPAGVEVIPANEVVLPIAETQVGTVVDNSDPKGLGRVKVAMFWQKEKNLTTDWIRVLSPDAGGSDKVGKNRGFAFIPEVEDQVIIGFRYNDPNRPFVMGSMFHGKNGGGGGSGNNTKSLTTKGGSTVTLDEGSNTITISDPSKNVITLNGDGTITISAPNKIDIKSKEINITAEQTVNVSGQNKVEVKSKEIVVDGTSKVTVNSSAQVEVGAPSTNIEGKAQLKLQSKGIIDLEGTAMANLKGGLLNLNCG